MICSSEEAKDKKCPIWYFSGYSSCCVGSKCMAWKFIEGDRGYCTLLKST